MPVRHRLAARGVAPLSRLLLTLVLLLGVTAFALPAVAGVATPRATPDATPAVEIAGYDDVVPSQREAVAAATAADISRYAMDIAVDPEAGTIGGDLTVAFTNRYGEPIDTVWFRLFPNADHYGEGGTVVRDTSRDGEAVDPALTDDPTVLGVPLAGELAPGGSVTIGMTFTTTVPLDSQGSYGILSRSSDAGTWSLADWYPILAGYEPAPGPGWRLDPPFSGIDPTFGDVALYDVSIDTAGLGLVSTGSVSGQTRGDTMHLVAGPARDFTVVLGSGWAETTRTVGETTVRYATTVTDEAAVDAVLDVVTRSLASYGERFGAYPSRELELVDVPLTAGTLGISWASLVQLDGPSLAAQAGDPQFLDFLLSHEVGHQWWGHLVGFNSNDHTFLTEGLTNYLMTAEVEWSQGRPAAVAMLDTLVAPRYLSLIRSGGDAVADTPFPDAPPGFGDLVYGKAALGFLAIRLEIGDDAFFGALATFAGVGPDGFRFRVAEPGDLLAAFETASGRDLGATWDRWFLAADMTTDEVEALLDEYAAG